MADVKPFKAIRPPGGSKAGGGEGAFVFSSDRQGGNTVFG